MLVIERKLPPWLGRIVTCCACQSTLRIDQVEEVSAINLTTANTSAAKFELTCPVCHSQGLYEPPDFKLTTDGTEPVPPTITKQP